MAIIEGARKQRLDRVMSKHLNLAMKAAIEETQDPIGVSLHCPHVFAGMAGSYVLTLTHAGLLNDGERDQQLKVLHETLDQHADPVVNEPLTKDLKFPSMHGRPK